MFQNYWTTAFRSLVRNKIYTLVNVLGLTLGICGCLVIYLITSFEFSFDTFHQDKDRIYCVDGGIPGDNSDHSHWNAVPGPMPAAMRQEISGFETVAAFQHYGAKVTVPGIRGGKEQKFDDGGRIVVAEPQYFDIFRYHWLSGNPKVSLNQPNSVVMTAAKAHQYFGDLTPDKVVGRTIIYDDSLSVTVTGVVADWTHHSDFDYSQWISYSTIRSTFLKNEFPLDGWFEMRHSSQVIVKLAKGVNPSTVDAQFVGFSKRHLDPQAGFAVLLKPLSGIHFHQEYGGEGYKASLPVLYGLMGVAGFILVLAFINFVNLSTAQSMRRAKEVGIRKVLGSRRIGISLQFFTETFVLTLASVILAVLLIKPVLTLFGDFVPQGVEFRLLDSGTLLFLSTITLVTTLVAGFYPARVLAGYLPALTLKGMTSTEGAGKGVIRQGLIVFQFTISMLFIIASIAIGSQLRFVLHTELGFKTDAVVSLRPLWGDKTGKMGVLAEKLKTLNGVDQVIRQAIAPMGRAHMGNSIKLKGSSEKPFEASIHAGNDDYIPFYGMKIVGGRNLLHSDSTRELLINETCAHQLGFADVQKAVGQMLSFGGDNTYPVAGVVADFYENSFHERIMPIVIKHDPQVENAIAVRISAKGKTAGEVKTTMTNIEREWKAIYPEQPFGYSFLQDDIANLYASDMQSEWLINVATGITIFISCLGLLGLAIFSMGRRTREIGIRKVLGASVSGIVLMLCRDIVRLILLALLIATPLAWYGMHQWLQGFAYRTQLGVWMFATAGAGAIAIALLTIGFQAMKAALANPANALRTE